MTQDTHSPNFLWNGHTDIITQSPFDMTAEQRAELEQEEAALAAEQQEINDKKMRATDLALKEGYVESVKNRAQSVQVEQNIDSSKMKPMGDPPSDQDISNAEQMLTQASEVETRLNTSLAGVANGLDNVTGSTFAVVTVSGIPGDILANPKLQEIEKKAHDALGDFKNAIAGSFTEMNNLTIGPKGTIEVNYDLLAQEADHSLKSPDSIGGMQTSREHLI